MEKSKPFYKKLWFWILATILGVFLIGALSDDQGSNNSISDVNFKDLAQTRFNEIASGFNKEELESIECLDDCNSVAYFNFKTVPDDLELVMKSNASLFSKFKLDKLGVSHVTLIARMGDEEVFMCNASEGRVDKCE